LPTVSEAGVPGYGHLKTRALLRFRFMHAGNESQKK